MKGLPDLRMRLRRLMEGLSLQFWLWLLIALSFMAGLAVSLLAPIGWADYGRYILREFGWPLVAAIATAAAIVLGSLLAVGRRKTSGVVALGIFISIVAHMLAASLFGSFVLSSSPGESPGSDTRPDVSSTVPPLAESMFSQDMRAQFTATTPHTTRDLAAPRKMDLATLDPKTARRAMDLKPEQAGKPLLDKVDAVQAAPTKARILDSLAKPADMLPDVETAKLVAMQTLKTTEEVIPSSPALRALPSDMPRRPRPDTLAAPDSVSMDVAVKDAQRTLARSTINMAKVQPDSHRSDEDLRPAPTSVDKVSALAVKADPMASPSRNGRPDAGSAEPARAIQLAHRTAATPEAPAPALVARELKTVSGKPSDVSLSDSAPGVDNSQSPLRETAMLRGAAPRNASATAPLRMAGALQALPTPATGVRSPVTADNVQKNVTAAKGTGSGWHEAAPAVPSPDLAFAESSGNAGAWNRVLPAVALKSGTERPAVMEQLMASASPAVRDVLAPLGGRAEGIQGAAPASAGAAFAATPDYTGKMVAGRRGALYASLSDVGLNSPPSVGVDLAAVLTRSGAGGARADMDMPGATGPSVPSPSGDATALTGPDVKSWAPAVVDVGAGAAPATVPAPGRESGRPGNARRPASAERDLGTGRVQPYRQGLGAATDESRPGQRATGEGLLSGSRVSHDSFASDADGLRASTATGTIGTLADSSISPATGGGNAGAAVAGSAMVPGSLQSLPMEVAGGAAAGSPPDGQGLRAGLGLSVGKADGSLAKGMAVADERRPSLALPSSSRGSGHGVSLAGTEPLATAAPQPGDKTGIGTGPDVSLIAPARFALNTGGSEVAFGTSGRELAGPDTPPGGNGTAPRSERGAADILIAKAGGGLMSDAGASGGDWIRVDAAALSESASRPHARMDIALSGAGGQGIGRGAQPAGGGNGSGRPRLVISTGLSSVPKTVPEKALYKLRTPERRKESSQRLGGSDKTEQAVEEALVWLAAAQSDDGRWDVDGFKTLPRVGGPGDRSEEDVALTGLCLLSYLGAGYTHVRGDHAESVRKALNWLVDGQKPDGNLQREGQMYGQAMATIALCEAYSMTGDTRLREPVEKAVDFILKAQTPRAGWRYEPRKESDTSVTGWQVLALKSATIAGVKVPPEHFQWVEEWLDRVRRGREGGLYGYMPGQGATPTMTAEGWFCQLMMEEKTRLRGQNETIPYLMAHLPAWSAHTHGVNLYLWYYATLALHMSGAPEFATWNKALVNALLSGQVKRGTAQGSWDPVCVLGERGGRVYMTATATLCLEVYYRYLPFYKQ